ncbi:MAG: DUF302 domain-containing protein [Gemmatimonadetes bacterium]|nr:DUF302 domain-containing protein [Gemmatimonadota bacterium]MBK7349240.1 DUF302 domain-containing protein [Gemmatimonadota bacterium]MBK7783868.1 DUF302 domain-containing protein [Gemmatimonadota bacterium]MBK7924805.1 DUF302 domain-containing protein [Gemmatimonadota bacterium]
MTFRIAEGQATAPAPASPRAFRVKLPVEQAQAVARLTHALAAEGFGIVTRADLQATFREKLGLTYRPYLILGVCNPSLAHRALEADPEAGLHLPCPVTVEADPAGGTVVRIADPAAIAGDGALATVAAEARELLGRVADHLRAHARTIAF